MPEKEKQKLDHGALSSFLLKEAIRLTKDLLWFLKEEDGDLKEMGPFCSCGPKYMLYKHKKIGKYLKYASLAHEIYQEEFQAEIDEMIKKDKEAEKNKKED